MQSSTQKKTQPDREGILTT